MVALSNVLAGIVNVFGNHLGSKSHFVVVGVVRQMRSHVVGMSNVVSGKLKIVTLAVSL